MRSLIKAAVEYFRYPGKWGISAGDFLRLSRYPKNARRVSAVGFFGKKIRFNAPFWFLHSLKEIFVSEVYKFIPRPEPVRIVDCGANIGLSVIYLRKLFPGASITAIEPDKNIFELLDHNLRVFDLENIELINAAAWVHNEGIAFHAEGSVGGSVLPQHAEEGSVKVKTIRLRTLLEEKVYFLKMDIEGAEYEVLKDCREQLHNVQNLFVEFHVVQEAPNQLSEVLGWIQEAGFSYYIKEAWNNMYFPFTKVHNDFFHLQLNIFCYR